MERLSGQPQVVLKPTILVALISILVLSFIFSLVHIFNEDFSWIGGVSLFLHGILFGLVYFKTRSLWVPIGLHVAWNWTQGPLWGMKVSGTGIAHTFMVSVPKGPELLSGGEFGAEGSLITVIVSAALVLYVWKAKWIRPTEEKAVLWRRYPLGFGLAPSEPHSMSADEPNEGQTPFFAPGSD